MARICYKCKNRGHISTNCTKHITTLPYEILLNIFLIISEHPEQLLELRTVNKLFLYLTEDTHINNNVIKTMPQCIKKGKIIGNLKFVREVPINLAIDLQARIYHTLPQTIFSARVFQWIWEARRWKNTEKVREVHKTEFVARNRLPTNYFMREEKIQDDFRALDAAERKRLKWTGRYNAVRHAKSSLIDWHLFYRY